MPEKLGKKKRGNEEMLNMLWTGEYNAEWEENFKKVVNLKRAGFNVHNQLYHWMSEEEVIEALQGIDIFFVGYDPITENVLKNCPDLKLILSVRDGPEENVDLEACKKYGIPVLNSAGRCTVSVAELTMNLMMNMARPVIDITTEIRKGRWVKENYQELRDIVEEKSFELYRKTLGIVGFGRNGQHLAKLAKGFGMDIIAYDPFLPAEVAEKMGVKLVELNDLMASSDYISVLARVTPENHNLVGKEQIALMKPTAALVNTGRPQLVDYDALKEALMNDKIRMAAIDVFKPEPISLDDTFYKIPMKKLILTNHMAGFCNERAWHQYDIGMDNINKFLKGECLQNNCTRGIEETEAYEGRGKLLFGIWK